MTKEKSITGGEVEALKREATIWYDNQFGKGVTMPTDRQVMWEFIDYLASKGHLKTTGEDEKGGEWVSAPPHGTYEGLLCQFRALKTMINSMGQQISSYSKKDYSLSEKRLAELQASLDSERAMNSKLTEELDHLASTGRIRGEWKPISEAPRDGTRVLVWSDELYMKPYIAWWGVDQNAPEDGNEQEEWLTGDGDSWSTGYYYTPCKPTHWMPLPPAPKTDGVQEDLDRSTMERK